MKIKGLLLGMLTCAALAACSNEDLVDNNGGNQLNGEDAYVAVAISNPAATFGARATAGDVEVGTAEENTVTNATFLFYDAKGNYITNVVVGNNELKLNKDKQTSDAVLVLKNTTIEPASMITILNAPVGLTLSQPKAKLLADAGAYGYGVDNNFVMSNSVYKDENAMQVETSLVGKIQKSETDAKDNFVEVYVERVLAKVTVSDANLDAKSATITLDGQSVTYKPVVTGWILNGVNETSYLVKNLAVGDVTGTWAWGTNRSFWAKDVNYEGGQGDLTFKSYENAAAKATPEYCLENTLTIDAYKAGVNYTHLLVTAQIQNTATGEALSTFCYYNGVYYTEAVLKGNFVSALSEYKYDNRAITAADIEFVQAGSQGNKAYMAEAKFKDESKTTAEAVAALKNQGQFQLYADGKCYFWTAIEHFGPAGETGSVGVVRNHVYALSLQTISGLGTPVVDPTQPIIPEKPSDDNSYLAAKVNILSWKMVSQNVDLK